MDNSEIIAQCLVDEKGRDLLKHANSFGKGLDGFALFTLERYLEGQIDFNEAYDLLTESYTNPWKTTKRYLQAIAKNVWLWLVVLAAIIYALWINGQEKEEEKSDYKVLSIVQFYTTVEKCEAGLEQIKDKFPNATCVLENLFTTEPWKETKILYSTSEECEAARQKELEKQPGAECVMEEYVFIENNGEKLQTSDTKSVE